MNQMPCECATHSCYKQQHWMTEFTYIHPIKYLERDLELNQVGLALWAAYVVTKVVG